MAVGFWGIVCITTLLFIGTDDDDIIGDLRIVTARPACKQEVQRDLNFRLIFVACMFTLTWSRLLRVWLQGASIYKIKISWYQNY